MSQPVNLSNECYSRLTFFKKKRKHRSYSAAVEDLLSTFWSPTQAVIAINEHFQEFQNWLESRELIDERTSEALQITRARCLQFHQGKQKMQKLIDFDQKEKDRDLERLAKAELKESETI